MFGEHCHYRRQDSHSGSTGKSSLPVLELVGPGGLPFPLLGSAPAFGLDLYLLTMSHRGLSFSAAGATTSIALLISSIVWKKEFPATW